jgi:DNA-binding response OmpR family regulator
MKVLLIENDFADQQLINLALSKTDIEMEITNVSTVAEVMKNSPYKGYDFIFISYNLPRLNGVDYIKLLRKKGCSAAIVLITQNDDISVAEQAIEAGANNYITKELLHPFVLRSLIRSSVNINKSEQKILALLQRQENIIQSANIGTWEWNLENDTAILNDKWF